MKTSVLQFKFVKTTLFWTFLLGVVISSCGKKDSTTPPVVIDKAALQAAIVTAQALNDNTAEGIKPGQYTVGTKAALTTALTNAKTVAADATATQAVVNSATQNLLAAIAAYQGNLITEIAAANLIGFWKMNGNAADSSGKGNNGVVTVGHAFFGAGTPALVADRFGRPGMAYHFDKGGNIEVPYSSSLNPQELTISVWCKKDTVGRTFATDGYYMVALNRWNGYKLQFQGTNRPFLTVRTIRPAGDTGYVDHDGTLSLDSLGWYHVVASFKKDTMNFYVNGTLTHSWTGTDAPGNPISVPNTVNFTIGSDLPTGKYDPVGGSDNYRVDWGGFFTGDLDDVMFYNTALTAPQVQLIYNNQKDL